MRFASPFFSTRWIPALCLMAAALNLPGASAQAWAQDADAPGSKLSRHTRAIEIPAASHLAGGGRASHNPPPPLTADSWTGSAGDNSWNTAGNWNGGVPTSSSAVTIGTTSAGVNLSSGTGSFGTLALSGSGDSLAIANNAVMDAFGNITNNGSINLNSSGNVTELVLEGNVTLSGSGTLTLSNNTNNYIFGGAATDQLTNQQTIQGAGQIGDGKMALANSGTIDANQSAGLTINANDGFSNTGTAEATAGSKLTLQSTVVNNAGGTFSANTGTINVSSSVISGGNVTLTGASTLQLNTGTIGGGTVTNSSTGTIEIASGTNALGGSINNSAGGTFKIDNNAILDLQGGTYSQLGTVQLNSSGNVTELVLAGSVTLSGGAVTLSNNASNYIFGMATADTLTNEETISGAGHMGNNSMTLVNSGTIDANQSAGMTIQANGGITNTGTLEATAGATLLMTGSGTVNNIGGIISANTGTLQLTSSTINGGAITLTGASALQLNSATIHGGSTLTNSSTGTIEIATGTSTLGGIINNSAGGTFKIDNNATLDLEGGAYSQLGNVQLNSSGNLSELVLEGNVTLSGGSVTLSNNANNYIFGQVSGTTLTNQETISGAGHIGNNLLTLVNSGTIDSNQSAGMTIQANGGVTNTGTLEATSGATLLLTGAGTINNVGGTIAANTGTLQITSSTINGGAITLTGASALQTNTATIQGGTLTNSSTGTIEIASGTNVLGGTINNSAGGTFKIDNNAVLELQGGSYSQLGTVQLNSSGNLTELVLEGNATLSGGTVTLSNNINNYIFGQISSDTLTNQEAIQGAGHIGNGQMTLVNAGTGIIDANQSSAMTLQANGGVSNAGLIEATSGATLTLTSTTMNNAGGTFSANTGTLQVNSSTINGGTITLTGASALQLNTGTIHGGSTLTNSSTGTIEVASGTNLLGGVINNSAGGILKVDNNAVLQLEGGTYAQLGAVQLNSSGNLTEMVLEGNVTLSGGTVTLANNANNYIFGAISSDTLTNQETIQGAGHMGNGAMTLVNSGTINANQSAAMTIQANGGASNTGTIESTAGATLALSSTTLNNAGGTLAANTGTLQVTSSTVNGGNITLTGASALQLSNGTIHGGSTITNSSTGTIEATAGTSVLGGTVNNSAGGIIKVDNNAILQLEGGTYSQIGAVQLNSSGNFTELVIEGNTTLSGGTVTMSGNANNLILGAAAFDVLTNQATIQGAGNIGNAGMGLVNAGTITANASGNLVIDVSNQNFSNTGTIQAAGATLTIEGPGVTFFTNDNQSTATLTGGTYIANGSNIQWAAGTAGITTLAANVTEEGGGQLFNTTNSANALAGLTGITSAGALTIGGVAFTDAGSFSNAGSLTLLSGESFTVGSLSQISGGSLTAGTFVLNANLNLSGTAQTITSNAANLTLAGGTIENTANSSNALAALASNSGKLTIGGSGNNLSTTAASFSNTGTLTINGGDSYSAAKLTQISGGTLSGGTFILGGNLNLTDSGIGVTTNSATLTLQGGTINSNGVNALSGLIASTKSLTLANNANLTTATTGNFTNSGTLTVSGGSTFTVGGSGQNYKQTAGTTTVDGILSGGTGGAASFTGGTVLGGGTIQGNTSVGNASGTAVTINVGDTGKSGLLAITGTYTQLATGNLTGLINGTTAGSGFSQLSVTGTAALAGTINFTVSSGFQASLTLGETFTVLSAGSVSGAFSNSTIAINSSFHFNVTYTSTGVVLTVASGAAPASGTVSSLTQSAIRSYQPIFGNARNFSGNLGGHVSQARAGVHRSSLVSSRLASRVLVAATGPAYATPAGGKAVSSRRSWERTGWKTVAVPPVVPVRTSAASATLPPSVRNPNDWSSFTLARKSGSGLPAGEYGIQRLPVRIMRPFAPRSGRR
jgi:hypothetical protein